MNSWFRGDQHGGRSVKWLCALLLAVAWICGPSRARADRPGGVTAQTLAMPHGPASLKGLGESFEPSSATGTGSYSVAFEVPPGFLAPSPALSYSGGHGKSEVGQGWKLSTLAVYRQTDKGAPNFDERDRFCVSGGGLNDELVLVNEELHYYRLKNEGAYALLIRDPEDDSWTIRMPSGETSFLGSAEESREKSRGRTSRWFLDKHADRFGHWSEYHYFSDRGHVYLDEISYQLHAAPEFQNTVSFSYEDRPDVFTDYTYGDANTTALRLASVQMFHGARLLRTYRLSYDSALLFSVLSGVELTGEDGLKVPKLSFGYLAETKDGGELVTVRNVPPLDALIDGWGELEDVNADGLPDVITTRATDYRYYENIDGRSFGAGRTLRNSPDHELTEAGVVFADINGDGFRDLVHAESDHFRYYPGGDIKRGVFQGFGTAVELKSTSDGFSFTGSELKLGDQNHDGRIDLLWQKPGRDSWIINGTDDVLREQQAPELPLDVDFEDSRIELTDFNGDGLLDFVRKDIGLNSSTLWVWYGLGHGEFTAPTQVPGVPKGDPNEFHLQDVNHDGQADLLRISGSWATVYLNRGGLGFSAARGDFQGLPAASETLKLLFADMNGNGTTDVVWVTKDFKLRYLELSGEPHVGLLSQIDNGMGLVTDVAYRSSTEYAIEAKAAGEPWIFTMPTPTAVVSEVRTTDSLDVLGFAATETRSTFDYRDGYYDGKEKEFRGFAGSRVTSWGDDSHETLVTKARFHVGLNPVTLQDEEVLKGKALSLSESDLEGHVYASTESAWQSRWLCQSQIGGGTTVLPDCEALGDLTGKKDQLVAIAIAPGTLTASIEKTSTPKLSFVASEFDAWGTATKVTNYGEVTYEGGYRIGDPLDLARVKDVPGDEEVEVHEALYDTASWLIALPTESHAEDTKGNVFDRSRNYYDGLGFGKATKGLQTRTTEYDPDTDRWVDVERHEYDSHGNVTASVNAVGDRSELRYESRGNFLPDFERELVGNDDWITFTAEHDLAYGDVVRMTDANGYESRIELDGLGRVVRQFDPGIALPVARYEYTFGSTKNPISVTRVDELVDDGGRYHSSWTYSDGAGRSRQEKETAENPYGYIATGWSQLSARGGAVVLYDPFPSQRLGLEFPPKGTSVTRTTLDGLGRPLEAVLPPTPDVPGKSVSRTEYYPWERRTYTERESTLGDLQHPSIIRTDGLARPVEIRKLNTHWGQEQQLVWRVGYDERGQVTSFADPAWNGRSDDTRHLRRYLYDGRGRLKTVRDPNAGRTDYERDDLDRIVRWTDALGQTQTWEYGLAGRVTSHKVSADIRGRPAYEHRYHYDEPAQNSPLEAPNSAHLRGKLSWIEFPTGEEHLAYDSRGQLSEEVHRLWNPAVSTFEQQTRDTFRRKLTYRADGAVLKKVAPGGFELSYDYDERGHNTRIDAKLGADSRTLLSDARYDHRGNAVLSDYGNGIRTCSSFNARGELTASATGKKTQLDCATVGTWVGGLHNLRYKRSYDGLIDSIEDRSAQVAGFERLDAAYEYDAIQQLVKVTDPRGSRSYHYDNIQNLIQRDILDDVRDEPTGEFGYGEGGAGPNAVTSSGGTSYAYDGAGQMLRYNGYDLSFNPEGLLVEASNTTTGVRIVQHYDDEGERRLALVYRRGKPVEIHRFVTPEYEVRDGEEVWFGALGLGSTEVVRSKGVKVDAQLLDQLTNYVNGVRAGPKPLPAEYMDLNGDGRVMDADDLALAQQSYSNETRVGGEKVVYRYTTADHLGSASHVTDSAGDVVSFERFGVYGKQANRTGQQPYRGGYLGKDTEVDLDLGLQRMGARYYAPALARFISPDPLIGRNPGLMVSSPLESNLYSYARNNPIIVRDPSGLKGSFFGGIGDAFVELKDKAVNTAKAVHQVIKETGEAGGEFVYGVVHDDPKATIRGGEKVEAALQHFTFEGQAEIAKNMAVGIVKDTAEATVAIGHHGKAAYKAYKEGDMTAVGNHLAKAVGNGLQVAATVLPLAKAGRGLMAASEARGALVAAEGVEGAEAAQSAGRAGRTAVKIAEKCCFTAGTMVRTVTGGDVPIEQIHVGQRLPSLGGSENDTRVDPVSWRLLRIELPTADGTLHLELLRSLQWIEEGGFEQGKTTHLEIAELSLEGDARVLAIEACPPIDDGAGEVVTGTISRVSGSVLRLSIEHSDQRLEVLEPTFEHPFYSNDRDAWVAGGELQAGERIVTEGASARVVSVNAKGGRYEVFNLEVEDAHSYLVGQAGVWVHNVCKIATKKTVPRSQAVPKPRKGPGTAPASARDPQRLFPRKMVGEQLAENGGACQMCGKKLKLKDAKGHHIQRHADAGKTVKKNLAVLCEPCHVEVHK